MVHKLYGASGRGRKIVATAKYNNIQIEAVNVEMGVTNKTPEFLKKNPTGKIPVLETEEGSIFESNAIVRYIARTGGKLYGKNNFEAALIDQFIDFSVNEIELPASAWLYPVFGFVANNPVATKKAREDIESVFHILDSHLLTRTFLVGNSISIADILVYQSLYNLYKMVLDAAFRKNFHNVNRWFNTIGNQPIIKEVYGEVVLCEKVQVAKEAPKEEKEGKKEKKDKKEEGKKEKKDKKEEGKEGKEEKEGKKEKKDKKDKKDKEGKEKKEEGKEKKEEKPKKEEKKEEKPKPKKEEEEDDGQEDYEKEEKKKPNPLDALPKSSFVLDEWKRMYSNNDTRSVALPWFFQNVDLEGYSLWKCDYKYNSELNKVFMASNLISGFFQRLEKAHKYAFSSMIVFGEEGKLEIAGIWLFRGPEIPDIVKESDDCEHYEWSRVDIKDEKQKKLLEDYFAWDGELGGKKYATGKVFK